MQVPQPLPYVGLDEETSQLSFATAKHLLKRTGFGATESELQSAIGSAANVKAEEVIDAAINLPLQADPPWATTLFEGTGYVTIRDYRYDMFRQMYTRGLREKMAFFWHDHFATEVFTHNEPAFTHKAIKAYRQLGFGNFFDLLKEIGKGPDMLYYLSGIYSVVGSPNENYARELLELFTMGQIAQDGSANYTEEDIREIARALTGWQVDRPAISGFLNPSRHDTGSKTIWGQTDNYGYDSLHQLIEDEKGFQTAEFIVGKIYKYFVYEFPNEQIVSELATYFMSVNYNVGLLLKKLLKSKHFFQTAALGSIHKTPIDYFIGALRDSDMAIEDQVDQGTFRRAHWSCNDQGLSLLSPPDVSGWDEYRKFINVGALAAKWSSIRGVLYGWASDLPEQDLTNWAAAACNNSTDPPVIVSSIVERLLSQSIPTEMMLALEQAFRASIPDQEFENGFWDWGYPDASEQVRLLLMEIYKLPEYNLI